MQVSGVRGGDGGLGQNVLAVLKVGWNCREVLTKLVGLWCAFEKEKGREGVFCQGGKGGGAHVQSRHLYLRPTVVWWGGSGGSKWVFACRSVGGFGIEARTRWSTFVVPIFARC